MSKNSVLVLAAALAALFGCSKSNRTPVVVTNSADMPQGAGSGVVVPQKSEVKHESPLYKNWHGFSVGSFVVLQSKTETKGQVGLTTTTTRYTILEDTDEHVAIEMVADTIRYDGEVVKGSPEPMRYTRWIEGEGLSKDSNQVSPSDRTDANEESLTVVGKTIRARSRISKDRNEAGEVRVQSWYSGDVPGSLVKARMETPGVGKLTTIELIEGKFTKR